jgi:hypothetical protein
MHFLINYFFIILSWFLRKNSSFFNK